MTGPTGGSLLDGRVHGPGCSGRRHEARGGLLGTQGTPKLHKIITHNVTNDPASIGSVHDRFATLSKFLLPSRHASPDSNYRIDPPYHILVYVVSDTGPSNFRALDLYGKLHTFRSQTQIGSDLSGSGTCCIVLRDWRISGRFHG